MQGVMPPSKHLSLNFLKGLIQHKYLSENCTTGTFKEYCEEEVRDLYATKADKKAEALVKKADQNEMLVSCEPSKPKQIYGGDRKMKLLNKKEADKNMKQEIKELKKLYKLCGCDSNECWDFLDKNYQYDLAELEDECKK